MHRPTCFLSDLRGAAAVEFAILAPVMILIYLGMAEFCQGFMAQKRMGHVAAMAADLVAQDATISKDGLDGVFEMGVALMAPFPTTSSGENQPLRQRITSVTRGADGIVKVDWSYGPHYGEQLEEGDVVEVPADLIANGESLVMSDAEYDYDSLTDYVIQDLTTFEQTYYLRPRTANMTNCTDC